MQFKVSGNNVVLEKDDVIKAAARLHPEPIQVHAVRISGKLFPVKQAFEASTGLPRTEFTSHIARRALLALGFDLVPETLSERSSNPGSSSNATSAPFDPKAWPWEGAVQNMFASIISDAGWDVKAMADTATKAHGVDVLAELALRRLGAEVKGWPSIGYADPRRAAETKRTQPSTQAGHWFSQALMKAVMLRDTHPDYESLIVVPDYPRYRDLATRTRTGRKAAEVHVVLVAADEGWSSETWVP